MARIFTPFFNFQGFSACMVKLYMSPVKEIHYISMDHGLLKLLFLIHQDLLRLGEQWHKIIGGAREKEIIGIFGRVTFRH